MQWQTFVRYRCIINEIKVIKPMKHNPLHVLFFAYTCTCEDTDMYAVKYPTVKVLNSKLLWWRWEMQIWCECNFASDEVFIKDGFSMFAHPQINECFCMSIKAKNFLSAPHATSDNSMMKQLLPTTPIRTNVWASVLQNNTTSHIIYWRLCMFHMLWHILRCCSVLCSLFQIVFITSYLTKEWYIYLYLRFLAHEIIVHVLNGIHCHNTSKDITTHYVHSYPSTGYINELSIARLVDTQKLETHNTQRQIMQCQTFVRYRNIINWMKVIGPRTRNPLHVFFFAYTYTCEDTDMFAVKYPTVQVLNSKLLWQRCDIEIWWECNIAVEVLIKDGFSI